MTRNNTLPAATSKEAPRLIHILPPRQGQGMCTVSAGPLMKKVVNFARDLGADPLHLLKIRRRGAFDRLQGPEMLEERALAARTDPGDFLQPGFADVAAAARPVRAYRKAVGFVAQALHEIEHRIARLEAERRTARNEEALV